MKYVIPIAVFLISILTQTPLSYSMTAFEDNKTLEQKFKKLAGIGYSPYTEISPLTNSSISEHRINQDLRILDPISDVVRLYELNTSTENIIKESLNLNKSVYLSLSITNDFEQINEDITQLLSLYSKYANISGIIFDGYSDYDEENDFQYDDIVEEQILELIITEDELRYFIKFIREQNPSAKIGLTLNEEDILKHDSLIQDFDFVIYAAFPYWMGLDVETSLKRVFDNHSLLTEKFPNTTFIIETGWPNKGEFICNAKPSDKTQYDYITNFIKYSALHDVPYILFSLFDQSWKRDIPNNIHSNHTVCSVSEITKKGHSAENNWGLFNSDRKLKPHFYEYFDSNFVQLLQPLETKDDLMMINGRIAIPIKTPILDESVQDGDSLLAEITGRNDNREHDIFLVGENSQILGFIKTQLPATIIINSQYRDNLEKFSIIMDEDPAIVKQLDDWRLNPVFGDFENIDVKFFKVPVGYGICLDFMQNCNKIEVKQRDVFIIDIYGILALVLAVGFATLCFWIRTQVGYIQENHGSSEKGMDPPKEKINIMGETENAK